MRSHKLASSLALVLLSGSPLARAAEPAPKPAGAKPAPAAKPGAGNDLEPEEDDAKEPGSATDTGGPKGPGKKVLVLPYQAIFRSVPQAKLDRATSLLQKELAQREAVEVLRGGVATESKGGPTLDSARIAAQSAEKEEQAREIAKAVQARKDAIAALEQNASAIDDVKLYIRAHHELARTLMVAGKDQEARAALDAAARLDPAFEVQRAAYPRLYQKWFGEVSGKVVAEPRGEVLVKSALPGAAIELDGRHMDVAPVVLENVVPGKHLITAKIDGVPPYGITVSVAGGKQAEITATFSNTAGGSDVGRVADAIAQNNVPAKAVQSAAAAGKQAGAAFVVFGAMAKDDDRFRVHTYVVDANSAKIASLEELSFDLEMLTSESDVLRIAQNAAALMKSFNGNDTAIATVEKRVRGGNTTVNHVSGAPLKAGELAEAKGPAGAKKPPVKTIFKPLKGGKIEIKDEEE